MRGTRISAHSTSLRLSLCNHLPFAWWSAWASACVSWTHSATLDVGTPHNAHEASKAMPSRSFDRSWCSYIRPAIQQQWLHGRLKCRAWLDASSGRRRRCAMSVYLTFTAGTWPLRDEHCHHPKLERRRFAAGISTTTTDWSHFCMMRCRCLKVQLLREGRVACHAEP